MAVTGVRVASLMAVNGTYNQNTKFIFAVGIKLQYYS